MGTKLSMRQLREILQLKHEQQLTHRAIARACWSGNGRYPGNWTRQRLKRGVALPRARKQLSSSETVVADAGSDVVVEVGWVVDAFGPRGVALAGPATGSHPLLRRGRSRSACIANLRFQDGFRVHTLSSGRGFEAVSLLVSLF